jgi:hypothetical protein
LVVGLTAMAVTLDLITFAMAYFTLGIGLVIERVTTLSKEELAEIDLV